MAQKHRSVWYIISIKPQTEVWGNPQQLRDLEFLRTVWEEEKCEKGDCNRIHSLYFQLLYPPSFAFAKLAREKGSYKLERSLRGG